VERARRKSAGMGLCITAKWMEEMTRRLSSVVVERDKEVRIVYGEKRKLEWQ
jgi:hypothetical protein